MPATLGQFCPRRHPTNFCGRLRFGIFGIFSYTFYFDYVYSVENNNGSLEKLD